jgi:type III pantothenate kinase
LSDQNIWIGLAIGNSRYHWAWFLNAQLRSSWDTVYLADRNTDLVAYHFNLLPVDLALEIDRQQLDIYQVPIYLISVVPHQTAIWARLPQVKQITLVDIPLFNLYPSLGIDRALAILGAGERYGYPVLVVDGGTALTITGVDGDRNLFGGAIIPGLRLQLNSLSMGTAELPQVKLPNQLPPRWANNTQDAIASGVLYTVCSGIEAFIDDWERLYPDSLTIFTGGDGELLAGYLRSNLSLSIASRIRFDPQLLFHGFGAVIN